MTKKESLRSFLLSAFFAVLTAVGGMLSIPLPPVPFSMQTFFVLASGLFLGPKYGPLSQILYIVMGLSGLPVFIGGTGGLHHVFSPTSAFLPGFVFASWIAGLSVATMKPTQEKSAMLCLKYVLICFISTVALYIVALPLFYLNMRYVLQTPMTVTRTLEAALLPFIIPDSIKAVVAGCLAYKALYVLRNAGLIK